MLKQALKRHAWNADGLLGEPVLTISVLSWPSRNTFCCCGLLMTGALCRVWFGARHQRLVDSQRHIPISGYLRCDDVLNSFSISHSFLMFLNSVSVFWRYHKQHLYTEMEMSLQWMFNSWAQELPDVAGFFMACIQLSNMNYPTIIGYYLIILLSNMYPLSN